MDTMATGINNESGNKLGGINQIIQTILLSVVCGLAVLIFSNQSQTGNELVRLKTIQDINVSNLDKMNTRVIALERDNIAVLQKWVEDNYLRKPQK